MARNNLTVVVKVQDLATKKIKDIGDALKELGGIASDVSTKFSGIDKVMAKSEAAKKNIAMSAGAWNKKQSKLLSKEDSDLLSTKNRNRNLELTSQNKHAKELDKALLDKTKKDQAHETSSLKTRSGLRSLDKVNQNKHFKELDKALLDKVEKEKAHEATALKNKNRNLALDSDNQNKHYKELDKALLAKVEKEKVHEASSLRTKTRNTELDKNNQNKHYKELDKALLDKAKKEQAQEKSVLAFKRAINTQHSKELIKQEKEQSKLQNLAAKKESKLNKAGEISELKRLSEEAKKATMDMTQFNKTMFTTAAFVGFFTKAFSSFGRSMAEAGDLDRVSKEYERVFGNTGTLFTNIDNFTTTAIDRMTAMKSAISLGQLGIAKNSSQAANIIAMAGTAAKMAGKDSSEGVEKITEALKTGSLSSLDFLNGLRTGSPALKAYFSIIEKSGGAMGSAMSAQAKYNLIFSTLTALTKEHLKDSADLADIVKRVGSEFGNLGSQISRLVGTALGPVINKFTDMAKKAADFIENMTKSNPAFLTMAKNIVVTIGALTSLIATFGTLRLVSKAIMSLGFGGIPLLIGGFLLLGQVFEKGDGTIKGITDTLKTFGAVITGVAQLVSSFLLDSDNYAKGVGKMDKSLHDFLKKKGLLGLTEQFSRFIAVVAKFSIDVGKKLIHWVDIASDKFGKFTSAIKDFLGIKNGAWSRSWVDNGNKVRDSLVAIMAIAAPLLALGGAKTIFSGLSKIPFLGALVPKFLTGGGLGKGPKGTENDPIYTKSAGGVLSKIADKFGVSAGGVGEVASTMATSLRAAVTFIAASPEILIPLIAAVATYAALKYVMGKANDERTESLKTELKAGAWKMNRPDYANYMRNLNATSGPEKEQADYAQFAITSQHLTAEGYTRESYAKTPEAQDYAKNLTPEERVSSLEATMRLVNDEAAKRMAEAMAGAMALDRGDRSPAISKEEMEAVLAAGEANGTVAKYLQKIAKNTAKQPGKSQRC